MKNSQKRVIILLIQNQQNTLLSVQKALEENQTRCRLLMVGIGQGTLSYLRRDGPYTEAPVPDLVLFDLSDGASESVAMLKAIKTDKRCRSLPMVLLTSDASDDALEILLKKSDAGTAFSPVDLDSFIKALNSFKSERFMNAVALLENFGFVLVRMPETVPIPTFEHLDNVAHAAS